MNLKRLASIPLIFGLAIFIATAFNESNLHRVLMNQSTLKQLITSSDSKTYTFFIQMFVCLLSHVLVELFIFVSKKKNSRFYRNIKDIKNKLTQLTVISFMSILSGYIMKVNDDVLCRFSVSIAILTLFYLISLLIRLSVLSFIFISSIYYNIGLLFAFSFIKYFSMIYQFYISFFRSFYLF